MFKPTAPQLSRVRLRMTTKNVGKGYYKGTRTGSMGGHTQRGQYIIDYRKVRTYVCPKADNENMLTPFVTNAMQKTEFTRPEYSEETGQIEQVKADRFTAEDLWRLTMKENDGDRETIVRSMDAEEEDQSIDGAVPEQEDEPKIYFGMTWHDVPAWQWRRFQSREQWEHRSAKAQAQVERWYADKLERLGTGLGLGGPKARKIKAW